MEVMQEEDLCCIVAVRSGKAETDPTTPNLFGGGPDYLNDHFSRGLLSHSEIRRGKYFNNNKTGTVDPRGPDPTS